MAIDPEIRILNPSSPRYGYKMNFMREIRDLLEYTHSRFYAALLAIVAARSVNERKDMQLLLQEEVVGLAAARYT